MIVFVHDVMTDDLITVVYDVIEIRKEDYNNLYILRVCDVSGNYVKYYDCNKYYIKVV